MDQAAADRIVWAQLCASGRHDCRVDGSYAVCRRCPWTEELQQPSHPARKARRGQYPAPTVFLARPPKATPNRQKKTNRVDCFERDRYTCVYCERMGVPLVDDTVQVPGHVYLTIDHVIPKSRGGSKGLANMATACTWCNNEKDDRTPAEWIDRWYHTGRPPKPVSFQRMRRELGLPVPAEREGFGLRAEPGADVSWPPKAVAPPPAPKPPDRPSGYVDCRPEAIAARVAAHNARNDLATPEQ